MRSSVSRTPRPTLPWWSIHSSPRSAVKPRPSVMPYTITRRSAPTRPAQRCTSDGGIGDAAQIADPLQHRRGGGERGDAMALDRPDGPGRVEPLEHDQSLAGEQAEQ